MCRPVLALIFLIALLLPPAAGALTFIEPASVTNLTTPLSGGQPTATDTPNGFVLTGDVRVDGLPAFILATRKFQVGPLPEQISSSASENFKLVLSGGGDVPEVLPSVTVTTEYYVTDLLTGGFLVVPASTVIQEGNGFEIASATFTNPLESALPTEGILTPGNYLLALKINFNLDAGSGTPVFSLGRFLEFGGITEFSGFNLEIVGTPVPEPSTALLVAVGMLGMAVGGRIRS